MTGKLEKLEQIASRVDLAELAALREALEKCDAAYNENPTAAAGKNRDYARKSLDEAVERLWRKYYPEEKSFKNRLEAYNFLLAQKYKISRGKFYKDCPLRGAGMIRINPDGSLAAAEIEKYILKAGLVKKDDISKVIEKDVQRKASADADKSETYVEISRLRLEEMRGNLVPRGQVVALFVDRIKEFQRSHLSQGRRLSLRCAGKTAEEIQRIIDEDNRAILETYAREDEIVGEVELT